MLTNRVPVLKIGNSKSKYEHEITKTIENLPDHMLKAMYQF
jgi:hypothetical protein